MEITVYTEMVALLRQIAGQTVVPPTSAALDLNWMITLNETGAFLWERLTQETDEAALGKALLSKYDVNAATAKASVAAFVYSLRENGFLTE